MRLPCRALIAGDNLNADAITAAMIVLSEQGTPARLFFIVHFFPCIFLIVVSPLPLLVARRRPSWPFLIATPSRRCRLRCASIVSFAPPPIRRCPIVSPSAVISRRHCPLRTRRRRPSCVDFHHTGVHQNAAVALLGLFQEGTADDELIVGLDSLSLATLMTTAWRTHWLMATRQMATRQMATRQMATRQMATWRMERRP